MTITMYPVYELYDVKTNSFFGEVYYSEIEVLLRVIHSQGTKYYKEKIVHAQTYSAQEWTKRYCQSKR